MKPPIYKRESSRLQKEILTHLRLNIIFFLIPTSIVGLSIPILDYLWFHNFIPLLFLFAFIWAIPFIAICWYVQWISRLIQHTLVKAKLNLGSLDQRENIDEILEKTTVIRKTISILAISIKTTGFLLRESGKTFLKEKINGELIFFLQFLQNLKSDLALHLSEQKHNLEEAKDEVTENIVGTTALEQVSELQKERLNRQIEQFEELQKILVKG